MGTIRSFPPIANKYAKVLILGSMPGARSLEQEEYYAHPQNKFWSIMISILGYEEPLMYAKKKRILLNHGVALWDVIHSCRRNGSLDAHLRDIRINDFNLFLRRCPRIKAVFCNGQTAFKL